MDNIITYLRFRGDIPFKKQPFCEMDAMIMAILVSVNLEGCVFNKTRLEDAYKAFEEVGKKDSLDEQMEAKCILFKLCAESVRFKDILLDNYVKDIDNEEEKTFYAITFYYGRHHAYVAFRGTDGSLISWKENFNGLYQYPTPGQRDALKYLAALAAKPFLKITVIGHSKGANLAVFAAMGLDEKSRRKLTDIYCFDGPGYVEDISEKLSFLDIKDRIHAFIPTSSVVGRLFEAPYEKEVVKAGGNGFYQHDLFNWNVTPFNIVREPAVDLFSDSLSKKLNDWMLSIPIGERKRVVDELFDTFKENGISHITDIMHLDLHKIVTLVKCVRNLSSENRNLLLLILKQIAKH